MTAPAVLEFQEVTKVYTSGALEFCALNKISLSVYEREVVVIMGPSGAGKTTFLTIAGLLMRPTDGKVTISGIDVTVLDERRLPRLRREKIGFIFQNFNLLEALNALQNVELVMETRGVTGGACRRAPRRVWHGAAAAQCSEGAKRGREAAGGDRPSARQ